MLWKIRQDQVSKKTQVYHGSKSNFLSVIRRFAESKEGLTKTYNLEELDIPVIYEKPEQKLGFTYYQLFRDIDAILVQQLANIRLAMKCESDYDARIDIFLGQGVHAEAFGCEVLVNDDRAPWPRPAITQASEIDKLRKPQLKDGILLQQVLAFIKYAQESTKHRIPIGIVETESPFTMSADILEPKQLFLACCDSPKRVHRLLEMITEFTIEFYKEFFSIVERPAWPGLNFPSVEGLDLGIEIADDMGLIQLSPEMYQEFALPYNSWLSEEFGGISVHSCGNYLHNLDILLKIPNLRAIQVHSGPKEMDIEKTLEKVNGQCVVFLRFYRSFLERIF